MDLKEYIFNKVEPIIRKWDEEFTRYLFSFMKI